MLNKDHRRNEVIDIMKGMCIFFMIYGHLTSISVLHHNIIYSFHMPLFFFLGGYLSKNTYRIQDFFKYSINNFKRLLVPYFITMLIISLWTWRYEILKLRFNLNIYPIINMIWGSGDFYNSSYGVLYIGPLWFLFSMFIVRETFFLIYTFFNLHIKNNYIFKYTLVSVSLLISIFSICIYNFIQPIPWNIFPGLAALIFYSIGWFVKNTNVRWYIKLFVALSWPFAAYMGGVEMRACFYDWPIINFLGALGGIVIIYELSSFIYNFTSNNFVLHKIKKILEWSGRSSLAILCMHSFDIMGGVSLYVITLLSIVIPCNLSWMVVLLNFLIPIFFTYVIYKIPFLKKIFIK